MIFNKLLPTPEDTLKVIFDSIESRQKLLLTYLNQHSYNTYFEQRLYNKILNEEFIVYQADLGVYFALKILGVHQLSRLNGTDLNYLLFEKLIEQKIPIVLVGAQFDTNFINEEAKRRGINLAGYESGYFDTSEEENIIDKLSEYDARVFIVGMGVPRQELFAFNVSKRLNSATFICVGNFFEFYFGTKKRTPSFIRRIGLEWFFRLLTEPIRLWKRYLAGIPIFFYRILKLKYQKKY